MRLWIILTLVFIAEEIVSTNAALYAAYTQGYNLWLIHLLFLATVIVDVSISYYLGHWLQKKFKHTRVIKTVQRIGHRIEHLAGKNARRLALVFLGLVGFPYLTGIIASLLPISFFEALFFISLGDLLWYTAQWMLVLGVHFLVPNPVVGIGVILAGSVLVVIILRHATRARFGKI